MTLPTATATPTTAVTLVLDASCLDAAPRGSGVTVAEGTPGVRAKALTHTTAKWRWQSAAAGPQRHVVRLSYVDHSRSGAASGVADIAMRDAAVLLGTVLPGSALAGLSVADYPEQLVPRRPGQRVQAETARQRLTAFGRITVVGAAITGNGLAAIADDAMRVVLSAAS